MPPYRYQCLDCGCTYVGEQLESGFTCSCGKKVRGSPCIPMAVPLSAELQTSHNITAATKLRSQLCENWGINNKSHKTHGANFSGSQTLKQLIDNIVEPMAKSADRERVRLLVIAAYQYDIDTQMMA